MAPAAAAAIDSSHRDKLGGAEMADQLVRLGMALVVIAMISAGLYVSGSGRASAVEPGIHGIGLRP